MELPQPLPSEVLLPCRVMLEQSIFSQHLGGRSASRGSRTKRILFVVFFQWDKKQEMSPCNGWLLFGAAL